MSKPNRSRMKLSEMRAQASESMGVEPGVELEMEDGSVFHIPSPMLLDDDRQEALNALGDKGDAISTAKAILGEEQHLEFLAAGGHSNDVSLAWGMLTEEARNNPKVPR